MRPRRFHRLLAASLLLGTLGCGLVKDNTKPPPPPFRGRVDVRALPLGPVNRTEHAGKLGGIDYAVIHYLIWDDRIALLIWTDNETINYGANWSAPLHEGGEGTFDVTLDKIALKYRTTDGKTGPVTVAGQDLELSNGWLVLVSSAGGQTRVKQLQREGLKVQPDVEGGNAKDFEKLKTDPDVLAFYRDKK